MPLSLSGDPPVSLVGHDLLAKVALYTDNYVIISDCEDHVIWINESLAQKSGYSLEEIRGRRTADIFRGEETDAQVAQAIDQAFREGKKLDCDILNYDKDGDPFWVNLTVNPVYGSGDDIEYFITIGKDITLQKQKSQKVEEARRNAEKAAREKQKIVSILSHDIKSPLSSIIGSIDLLRDAAEGEEAAELLDVMQIASENMMNLVKNMLEISRIESGKFAIDPEPVDLRQLVQTIIEPLKIQARTANTDLELAFDEALDGQYLIDPIRFSQLVNNLVNNAIKFTVAGSIRVVVEKRSVRDGCVVIRMEVHDTGCGIEHSKQEAIFNRFDQAAATTEQKYEGSGLGLTIAKHIVGQMQGCIWLDSTVGEGTTFYVEVEIPKVP